MTDWVAIRTEYIESGLSYKKLSEKVGVPYEKLKKRALKEGWGKLKKQRRSLDVTPDLTQITNKLIQKTGHAIDRLDEDVDPQKLKQLVSSVKDLKELVKTLPGDGQDADKHAVLLNAIREAGHGN